MPSAQPMDPSYYQTMLTVVMTLVGVLITFLLYQVGSVKTAVNKSITTLFEKIDALAEKKVSKEQCKEFRDLCFRDCPYRRKAEQEREARRD